MTEQQLYQLQFPIGIFETPKEITKAHLQKWQTAIECFPNDIIELTNSLSIEEKNWKYRPDGWMLKQVVHHCADSHANALMRFKLTITENQPTIKPYNEQKWAILADGLDNDLNDSLQLLTILHKKMVRIIKNLSPNELKSSFIHPEHGRKFSLEETVGTYAWHGQHHLEHIKLALASKGTYNL